MDPSDEYRALSATFANVSLKLLRAAVETLDEALAHSRLRALGFDEASAETLLQAPVVAYMRRIYFAHQKSLSLQEVIERHLSNSNLLEELFHLPTGSE